MNVIFSPDDQHDIDCCEIFVFLFVSQAQMALCYPDLFLAFISLNCPDTWLSWGVSSGHPISYRSFCWLCITSTTLGQYNTPDRCYIRLMVKVTWLYCHTAGSLYKQTVDSSMQMFLLMWRFNQSKWIIKWDPNEWPRESSTFQKNPQEWRFELVNKFDQTFISL